MSDNVDRMRRMLLEETNYRCGYCMRNITPRVYYLSDDPNKTPIHDYGFIDTINEDKETRFYNISDLAHIVAKASGGDNSFYNLLALCKICHHEVDKSGMLTTAELKKQKLHYIVASGRLTRLEIDCLFSSYTQNMPHWFPIINGRKRLIIDTKNWILYKNLFKLDFAKSVWHEPEETHLVKTLEWKVGEIEKIVYQGNIRSFIDTALPMENSDIVNLNGSIWIEIKEKGERFCENFIDVYEDLD